MRVAFHTKREAEVQARNGSVSGSRLFRLLMCSLFTGDSLWAELNADSIMARYNDAVQAVYGNCLFYLSFQFFEFIIIISRFCKFSKGRF